ncbi:hypothetical protein PAL_GLEAN10021991 [Pteropus alecto]|uniref:Uncharacterized protein n=1 Tax=Pteropus alecto TaxID=9402 RepID=L5KP17_PTEAL|nr:hypothetical protein PAL_GLEAN10021991 [Pteropus alecto]
MALSQPPPGPGADTLLRGVTCLISKCAFSQLSRRKPLALLLREHVRKRLFIYLPKGLNAEPGFSQSCLNLSRTAPFSTSDEPVAGSSFDEPVMAGFSDARFVGVPTVRESGRRGGGRLVGGRSSRMSGSLTAESVGPPHRDVVHPLLGKITAESQRNCSLWCSENADFPCHRNISCIQKCPRLWGVGGGKDIREGDVNRVKRLHVGRPRTAGTGRDPWAAHTGSGPPSVPV